MGDQSGLSGHGRWQEQQEQQEALGTFPPLLQPRGTCGLNT